MVFDDIAGYAVAFHVILYKLVQPLKAEVVIDVTAAPIVKVPNPVHPENEFARISVTLSPIVTDAIKVLSLKPFDSTFTTLYLYVELLTVWLTCEGIVIDEGVFPVASFTETVPAVDVEGATVMIV